MKPEQIYEHLKDVAEKLNIAVKEKNLSSIGVKAKSGLCKLKNKNIFIMDKKKSVRKKNEILMSCLSKFQHDHIYVVPVIRDLFNKYKGKL